MSNFEFKIEKKLDKALGRAGVFVTPHGQIKTPAFVVVGTKADVKGLTLEQLENLSPAVLLANTYHLYFSPNPKVIKKAGGLHAFSGWTGPTMTDSGGFQAFSLGAAWGESVSKVAKAGSEFQQNKKNQNQKARAKITEDGVEFRSYKDGSKHFFSPEKSIQVQHDIGADIIFAFDECTSPQASYEYQQEAMERTHRWAERSLSEHQKLNKKNQVALFGVVQGGRHTDLRQESANFLGQMDFAGFGIGGSFDKDDMDSAVRVVNEILPEDKPRHLLGIGEPVDLFMGVENGVDLFDCVIPTRLARHGGLFTKKGKINIKNAKFKNKHKPIEKDCQCWTCQHHTQAYIHHLLREGEILGMTLASIHNIHFIVNLVKDIRQSILDNTFFKFKKHFLKKFYK